MYAYIVSLPYIFKYDDANAQVSSYAMHFLLWWALMWYL